MRLSPLSIFAVASAALPLSACSADATGEPVADDDALVATALSGTYSEAFSSAGYDDGAIVRLDVRGGFGETSYAMQIVDAAKCGSPCTPERAQSGGSLRVESGTVANGRGRTLHFAPSGAEEYTVSIAREGATVLFRRAGQPERRLVAAGTACKTSGQCGLRQRCAWPTCDVEREGDRCLFTSKECGDLGDVRPDVVVGAPCQRASDCAAPATCEVDPSWLCDRERPTDRCPPPLHRCVTRSF